MNYDSLPHKYLELLQERERVVEKASVQAKQVFILAEGGFRRSKRLVRKLRISRKYVYRGLAALLVIMLLGMVGAIRNQQLCSYQELVTSNRLVQQNNFQLCPNLFDVQQWPSILANILVTPANALAPVPEGEFSTLFNLDGLGQNDTVSSCTDVLNPECWLNNKPELNETDGYTNILLVGVDARAGYSNMKNADSVLLVSYSQISGDLLFVSFPRDLYLRYKRPNQYLVSGKINAVYANDDIEGLNYVVEQVSGKKIHYFVYLDLQVFEDALNALGGVTVNVPEDFTDYFPAAELPDGYGCPNPQYFFDGLYCGFTFYKGEKKLTPVEAMAYSRARKYTSDYGRAARQQDVAFGLIKEIQQDQRPLPQKLNSYIQLYRSFAERVKTNIQPKDVAGMFSLLDSFSRKSVRVVASPALENGRFVYEAGIIEGAGYSSRFYDETYASFQGYLNQIQTYLPFYLEQPKVLVINASGKKISPDSDLYRFINQKENYVELQLKQGNKIQTGNLKLYSFNSDKASSLKFLQQKLAESLIFSSRLDQVDRSEYKEDILIVVGEGYSGLVKE